MATTFDDASATSFSTIDESELVLPPAISPKAPLFSLRHWLSLSEKTSEIAEARLLSKIARSQTTARVGLVDLDGDGIRKINTLVIDQTGNDFEQEPKLKGNASFSSGDNVTMIDESLDLIIEPQTNLHSPSLPPRKNLVMCHGFGAGLGFFYRNYHTLSQVPGWRIYGIDWLGMGRSSRPKFHIDAATSDESVEQAENFFVDSLEKWREIHKIEKMTLLGHSLGGYFAAVYALKYPERVERLILVSPVGVPINPNGTVLKTPGGRTIPSWVARLWNANVTPQTILRLSGPFGSSLVFRYTSRRFGYLEKQDLDDFHDYLYHISAAPGSGEYALGRILAPGAYARKPLIHRLHGLKIPTTFLYGELDWMDYRAAEEVSRTMSVPTKVIRVPNAGHHLYLDNPQDFNERIIDEMLERH